MTASKSALIMHPDDRGWFIEAYLEASHERVPFAAKLRLRPRGGAYRWMVFHGTPLFREDGGLDCYAVTLTGAPN